MRDFNPSLDRHVRTKSRCSPFHCPYRHCIFTVCCSVFTFPLSLSSLYLHSLLLGVHLSTVLIVTVSSQFVARCSPFHCPYRHCIFTVCCSVLLYLHCLSVAQCSPFHRPCRHCRHCTVTVCCSVFTFPLSSSVTVPSLSVVQCTPFHRPHQSLYLHCLLSSVHLSTVLSNHCTLTVCCPVYTFPPSSAVTVPLLSVVQCTPFHRPQQSLYLHCLLSNVHLSTVLSSHCTFTVCCPVYTFPPSSAVTVPSVFVRCPVDSSCAMKLHPVLHCSS